ncbi:hypothetical protein CEUSTIGMA_g7364.t1 [Chlamydomonas eustigma]|uniref:60S ribosomal protein L35 n=1 Tax=Chlamydomonas eustigma TaxID=1157962 RepID=A0A250XA28_9CHLO|nr:hypothetical protein CEUSTIGMA_g7364.t1 [Chlamydomonas eustigma]|eukprot:GAX79924.1 hypothetical protein CEUSTIGMA_g7364.t1 [Chlamydomonas eustigma]
MHFERLIVCKLLLSSESFGNVFHRNNKYDIHHAGTKLKGRIVRHTCDIIWGSLRNCLFGAFTSSTSRMAKVKAYELRNESKSDLSNRLKELKGELGALRVAKVTGGAPNKLSKIKSVRKNIARVNTVYRQNQLTALRSTIEADAKNKNGKMYLPVDMRVKKTRAIRRRLTKAQASKKTEKQAKKIAAFPTRKYTLKA